MSVISEDKIARQETAFRNASEYLVVRLLAFLVLLVVALLVRPDLMQTATTAVMTMMH